MDCIDNLYMKSIQEKIPETQSYLESGVAEKESALVLITLAKNHIREFGLTQQL